MSSPIPIYSDFTQTQLSIELDQIIEGAQLTIHFQPIIDANSGQVLGWEALCRGPSDSPLHSPLVLFEMAARFNKLSKLELIVLKKSLMRFKELGLAGLLFLNFTVDSVVTSINFHREIFDELQLNGLSPNQIVIELTETRATDDLFALERGITGLKELGFSMAIDDLGEGFASLKRWIKMLPQFVKIDRHFIDGIHKDTLKQQFVKSIVDIAAKAGSKVIGEGVEEEADLRSLRIQGVNLIQGYLIAKPCYEPLSTVETRILKLLESTRPNFNSAPINLSKKANTITAGNLAHKTSVANPKLSCKDVISTFQADRRLNSLPVIDDQEKVVGVIRSLEILRRGTEKYFNEIFGARSCTNIMDVNPLIFDVSTTLRSMSEMISGLDDRLVADGFIVTENGRYFGSGKMTDLLKAVSDMQITSARYANPLTQLPGNVPIDEQILENLNSQAAFVVAYFDLDNFKPFNDVYGYHAGDHVILLTATLLANAINQECDFLGHIGGDDFTVIFKSADWQARIQTILSKFDKAILSFFSEETLAAGGIITQNRQGVEILHPLVSLSAGVVPVKPNTISTPAELSSMLAETKKMAKKTPGSSYFVDRRGPKN